MTLRSSLILAATTVVLALTAAPAMAHIELERSSPRSNATLTKAPSTASATFSGPLRRGTLRVTNADGEKVSVGAGSRDPGNLTRVRVRLRRGLPSGRYTMRASIVSADGHSQRFTVRFRIRR